MRIGMRRLKYFLAVAEQGNINRAAEYLHISQSALTRSIQALEENLGTILFQRTQRGVQLTTTGERLLHHARRISNTVRVAEQDMELLVRGGESEIRLGVSSTLQTENILDAVFQVLTDRPSLSVSIIDSFYDSLIQRLRLQELDIVLTMLPQRSDHDDFEVEILRQENRHRSVYARSGHPLLKMHQLDREALRSANWVISGEPHYQHLIDEYLHEFGIDAPKFRLKCSSIAWMRRAVLQEDFVALMTDSTVLNEFPSGSVRPIPGTTTTTHIKIGVLTPRISVRPVGVGRLIRTLQAVFSERPTVPNSTAGPMSH